MKHEVKEKHIAAVHARYRNTDVPKPQSSSLVPRISLEKVSRPCTCSIWYHGSASRVRLSVTAIRASSPTSRRNYADSYTFSKTYRPRFTHALMERVNEPISGSSNICASGLPMTRRHGRCYGYRPVLRLDPLCLPLRCLTCYLLEVPASVACDHEYQLHKKDCLFRHSGSSYPT